MSTERIDIYGGKATIKQNKFGVWQFRMWVSNEKRYYEKSLRTKRRAEAIDKAEEMYFDLKNELKDGRKLFSVSIADAVAIYLEHRKIDVRTKEIVEGLWVTIRTHLNHFIEYVGENEKAAIARKLDVKKNTIEPQIFDTQNTVVTNFKTDTPFYLRGYEAIEEKINLIKGRKDKSSFMKDLN